MRSLAQALQHRREEELADSNSGLQSTCRAKNLACCEVDFSRIASTRVQASGFFCSSLKTRSAATRCNTASTQGQYIRSAKVCRLLTKFSRYLDTFLVPSLQLRAASNPVLRRGLVSHGS